MKKCNKCGKEYKYNHCLDCYEKTAGALNVFIERHITEVGSVVAIEYEVNHYHIEKIKEIEAGKMRYLKYKEKHHQWVVKHRDYSRQYYLRNKEKLLEKAKLYRESKSKRKINNEKIA